METMENMKQLQEYLVKTWSIQPGNANERRPDNGWSHHTSLKWMMQDMKKKGCAVVCNLWLVTCLTGEHAHESILVQVGNAYAFELGDIILTDTTREEMSTQSRELLGNDVYVMDLDWVVIRWSVYTTRIMLLEEKRGMAEMKYGQRKGYDEAADNIRKKLPSASVEGYIVRTEDEMNGTIQGMNVFQIGDIRAVPAAFWYHSADEFEKMLNV